MIFSFAARNPVFILTNPLRSVAAVRRAMKEILEEEKCCQFCLSTKSLEVHHKKPISIAPDLAAVKANLITLCKRCHFSVGHFNNYHDHNPQIDQIVLFRKRA